MANSLKKRGQKFIRKFSRASAKASVDSKEHIRENFIQRLSHIKNIRLLVFEWGLLMVTLILLATVQAFWFRSSYEKNSFVDGGTYTEATVGRVNSMNPLFATTSSEKVLSKLMFATLSATDYSGQPGPALAETIRSSENGRTWTLRLRDNLKWSDGEPLTTEDVLFTISLIQNPVVNTIYGANLEGVKVSESENGDIVFNLPAGYADFISALNFPVVPKHILADVPAKTLVEAGFSNSPVTSGAFSYNAVQAGVGEDEKVFYLSANSNYYLGKPMVGSFAVHTYASKDDVAAAMNSGAITATAELGGLDADKVVFGNYDKRYTNINSGAFIFFNTSRKLMSQKSMRQAVRLGIDLAELRAKAPNTAPLNYPILDSQIALSNYPELPGRNFDAARDTISALADGEDATINIATVTSGYLPAVADALAEQLRALGLNATVTTYAESQDFVANVIAKRNYDILLYDIELGADPDPLAYYHSSQAQEAGLNLSNYRNSLVDDLLVGARETMEETLRARKYESFLEYWVEDVPAIGIYQSNMTYIYNRNTRTYSDKNILVTPIDRFSDVEIWASASGARDLTP